MADESQNDGEEYYEYNIPYDESMAQYYQEYYQLEESSNPVAASAAPAIFESAEVSTTGVDSTTQHEDYVADSNAVPYPEGYIPSVTNVLLERKRVEETTFDSPDPALIGNPYAKNYQDPHLKRKEPDSDKPGIPEARKRVFRAAAGELWEDTKLYEWDPGKICFIVDFFAYPVFLTQRSVFASSVLINRDRRLSDIRW